MTATKAALVFVLVVVVGAASALGLADPFQAGGIGSAHAQEPPPAAADTTSFITTWKTTGPNESMKLPASGTYTVHWGDGTSQNLTGIMNHVYADAGTYTVSITGDLERFNLHDPSSGPANDRKLKSIEQWGHIKWTTMKDAFRGATNMEYRATDAPDLSGVEDMSGMFWSASSFDGGGGLSSWNVSGVTSMNDMFHSAPSFDSDLSSWNVSSATDMYGMFSGASSFDSDLSSWDVSSVADMSSMFHGASSFDSDLSSWDVSSVTYMYEMFYGASAFRGNLSDWDVSSVTYMNLMFHRATSFDSDLSGWNVSSATDMSGMFRGATLFNQPIGKWNVSSATDMSGMFRGATLFNQPIGEWDVSSATDMSGMFRGASLFQQNLGGWYVVPAATVYDPSGGTLDVTTISAQNNVLDGHNPEYGIGGGADSALFAMAGNVLSFASAPPVPGTYEANVTASSGNVFEDGGNWHAFEVAVTGQEEPDGLPVVTAADTVTSIERSSPAQQNTDSQLLVFEVNFSGPVTGVDPADFALSWNDTISPVQSVRTSEPALVMPDNGPAVFDAITVDSSGPAASVRVDVDITHALRNELVVSLAAPDGTEVVLHDRTGGERSDLRRTYAPDFGGTEMNGDWKLSVADAVPYESGVLNSWTLTINHDDSDSDGAAAVTGITGSGAQYFVTVPAVRDGTYNLDLVEDHGITDMAGRPLNGTAPTGADQSYTVHTGPPVVASIARHSPVQQDTDNASLVFGVAFSEQVTGVDVDDFALSVADGSSMETDRFERTSAPALAIPDSGPAASDVITANVSGTVASVRADVDITHPYAGDLQVDLISPDGTVVTLHGHGGAGTANLRQTYAPDFGSLRMDGDWTLRVGDIWEEDSGTLNSWTLAIDYVDAPESVTGSSGTQYLVTVPATRNGTYSLDVIQNSRITDMAGNPLDGTTQTRDDQSYNVTMTVAPATPVNTPPTADVGPDQIVDENTQVTLVGTGSTDPESDALTYMWEQISGTPSVTLSSSTAASPTFTVSSVAADTDLTFRLTVTDNGGLSHADTVKITITNVPVNTPPTADAGPDQTVQEGGGITLNGQASDDDGDPLTYAWSHDSSLDIVFGNSAALSPTVTVPQVDANAAVTVTLTADDGTDTASDTFELTITDVPLNNAVPFVTTWRTTTPDGSITIPVGGATGTYTIDWGDGTTSTGVSGGQTHTYAEPGDHMVSISGDFTRIHLDNQQPNAGKLLSIDRWGDMEWSSMNSAFEGASNMVYNATDIPNLSGATDISSMFYGAASFDGDLSDWDTSDVANMAGMFQKTYAFNGDLSGWNTSGVTDMSFMFNLAAKFNGDLSEWDTSDVANMAGMFWNAAKFNGDISDWDTSGVTDMTYMFNQDSVFSGDLSGWNTSKVTNMAGMFQDASRFRSNLSNWDTSEVTDMRGMFTRAYVFNGDISGWDVSAVTDMTGMLSDARAFDQNLGLWYVIPEDTSIDEGDATRFVTIIDAKNDALRNQGVIYGIGTGGDSASFDIANGNQLVLLETPHYDTQSSYTVNVTSTGFGTGNHHRVLDVTVTDNDYQPADAGSFITTWATASDDEIITFSTSVVPGGDITIDWGDGTAPSNVTAARQQSHEYAVAGSYTVAISGDLERFYFYSDDDASALRSLDQWGDMKWSSMSDMFYGAFDMEYLATDTPDLSGVTDMGYTFSGAEKFNGDLSGWDTSAVTNMADMFYGATEFDGDLSGWDVSSVADMYEMFRGASSFDSDLSGWDVSSATDMSGMFDGAHSFDQNLGNWYIVLDDATARYGNTPVTVGSIAAQNAFLDGQNLSYLVGTGGDSGLFELRGTDLILNSPAAAPSVTKNSYTVNVTSTGEFGTDNSKILDITINNPPVVNAGTDQTAPEGTVVTLNGTASDADGDPLTYSWIQTAGEAATLSGDDTLSPTFTAPEVTSETALVFELAVYDGHGNSTDTVQVLVQDAPDPDDDAPFVTTWRTATPGKSITIPVGGTTGGTYTVHWGDGESENATGTTTHAYADAGTYTVSITGDLERFNLHDSSSGPANDRKLKSIEQWGHIKWTTMKDAFRGATNMEYRATDAPDLSGVEDMSGMFWSASSFDGGGGLSSWNVSGVTSMNDMFHSAPSFDSDLSSWNVSSATDMYGMFSGASSFDSDLSSWDVSSVADMSSMFHGASSFDSDLSSWDVSSVTYMYEMFYGASAFRGNLSDWDVSSVTYMNLMFHRATSFDSDLSGWNVSSATDMYRMFHRATSFDSDLSGWNVSSATDMSGMFRGATLFNQPIGKWNVSSATDMSGMFRGATLFNQPIGEWDVSSATDMSGMFRGASLFQQNLGGWYVVPAATVYDPSGGTLDVTTISAQNNVLDGHNPEYGIGGGADSALFAMAGNVLSFASAPPVPGTYEANVTASSGNVFEDGGNWHAFEVAVTGQEEPDGLPVVTAADTVTSIERSSPAQQNTDSQLLVFEVNFSGPVTGVDPADFALSWNDTISPVQSVRTSEPALVMPDNGPAVFDAITVDSSGPAASVRVDVDITHALRNELVVSLAAPDGTEVVLHDRTGGERSDLRRTYAPDFGGTEMNGDWKLSVADAVPYESGVLNSWTLTINHDDSDSDGAAAVTGITGSGAQYFVTVPAVRDGTYNLDLVEDHGITDMAGRPLNGTAPTGADQSYTVHTGPPVVASIARHSPVQQDTDNASLVFGVAFSEQVTGVDVDDFALSVADGSSMETDRFERTSAPALAIPDSGPAASDVITANVSGTVASVRADVDITHPYAGDLQVDLISPDGTVVTLHGHGGAGTANLRQTYAPDFGSLRMDGDWTLRVGDIWEEDSGTLNSWTLAIDYVDAPESVTGSSGTQYLVTVPATRNGTYSLDVIQNSRITDMAGNPLDGTTQTRDDQSYNVTMTVAPATPVNTPPTADVGPDQIVDENTQVTLVGTGSTDPESDALTYMWEQISGTPSVTLSSSTAASPTFTVSSVAADTDLTFRLTVTDNGGLSHADTVKITITNVPVNTPPTADAGPDQTVQEGGGITLNGQASDDDGDPLTYAWSHDSSLDIVFGNSAALSPTVTVPQVDANAAVTVTLTADDGTDTASDTFELTITDVPLNNAVPFVTTWRTTTPDGSITIPVGGATGTYTIDWGDGTTSTGVSGGQTHTYAEPGDHMVSISGDFTRIHLDNQQPNAGKLLSIDRWGDMEWSSMNSAFEGASNMVYNATDIPNLSGATDISSMFYGAASFDGDFSGWDTSGVTDMKSMFRGAASFEGDISTWNTVSVANMRHMFHSAASFDGDLSGWDTSSVIQMQNMFRDASSFNSDISGWDTSSVTKMRNMFEGATSFDGDISGWDTSSVTDT